MATLPTGVWDITRWDQSVWSAESVPFEGRLENYTALVQAVIDLLRDDDVDAARAGLFIRQAHDKLQRDLMNKDAPGMDGSVPRQMMARATAITNPDSSIEVPNDFIAARSVVVHGSPSRFVSSEKIRGSAEGYGESDVEMTYYWRLPILSEANPTNWLFSIAPDAYLYGAALQYVPWSHEESKYNLWNTFYSDAVQGVKKSNHPRPRGGWNSFRGRPYMSAYTTIGTHMLFSGLGRNMGVY